MLLKINDIEVITYKEISYKYNNIIYYTFEYNESKVVKNNDIITFICKCGKILSKKFHPKTEKPHILCPRCLIKEKYGVENISQLGKIKEKIKQNNLIKYGVENISQLDEIKKKKKQTMIKNHGTNNPLSLEKTKKIIKEKYGTDNVNQIKEIRDKIKQTNLKKYGYETILKDKIKMKKIILEKYNNENYNNREKAYETNLKKYGQEQPWAFGSKNQIKNTLTKSYNKFLKLQIQPLFTLEEYLQKQNKYDKFKWQCKTCNTEFINYYENGVMPRCPTCYPKLQGYSLQEKEIVNYCKSLNIQVIENDREIIKPYEVDIYLPDYKLAIEFNGLYWHSIKFIDDKYYHQNKVKLANEKGIRLLHIWEHEWLEEKELIKETIDYYINNLNEEIKPEEPKLYNIRDNLIWI